MPVPFWIGPLLRIGLYSVLLWFEQRCQLIVLRETSLLKMLKLPFARLRPSWSWMGLSGRRTENPVWRDIG